MSASRLSARWWIPPDEATPGSVLERLRDALLHIASIPYGWGAHLHRQLYRRGLRRAGRLPCVVVSIGNVVVGGSAKTPLAAFVAKSLRGAGERVALASRGYGREEGAAVDVVSDGRHVCSPAARSGDEPWLLAGLVPGVPVLVGRDRRRVGLRAVSLYSTDVLVLDDGFQHHRLARDVSIVCVDAHAGFGNRRILPAGPLREPLAALSAADAVVVVDGALSPGDDVLLARYSEGAPRFTARRQPTRLWNLADRAPMDLATMRGRRVGLLSAIARPAGLRHTVASLGATVVAERHFRDHHRYRARDVARLGDDASVWITTEKDAMKIRPEWLPGLSVFVLGIDLHFEDPASFDAFLKDAVATGREEKRIRRGRGVHVA